MKQVFLKVRLVVSFVALGATNFVYAEGGSNSSCIVAGPENAPLTVEEFVDFQCPFCAQGARALEAAIKDHPTKVKVILRHRPLPFHPQSLSAAQAVSAVCLQNPALATAFQKEIFDHQDQLKEDGEEFLLETAEKLGLDRSQLEEDMRSPEVAHIISEDEKRADALQFKGTPSFVIGKSTLMGTRPAAEFKKIIERELQGGQAKNLTHLKN